MDVDRVRSGAHSLGCYMSAHLRAIFSACQMARRSVCSPVMTLQIELDGHAHDPGWRMDPAALAVLRSAACVMFERFHGSPEAGTIAQGERLRVANFVWRAPDAAAQATHRNSDDATRDGAYAVAFAAMRQLGPFVFVHRAERKTGADFMLVREGEENGAYIKLEVSGIGKGTSAAVARRLREKVQQVTRPGTGEPVLAVVVRFQRPHVAVEEAGVGLP